MSGFCKVRQNQNGELKLPYFGYITSIAIDPIEKKPLYHFQRGSEIYSVGFAGCNLSCPFCQNYQISQDLGSGRGKHFSPKELIENVITTNHNRKINSIAYTYSEPLVHIEYLLECMKEAHEQGMKNVLVSNGCVNTAAAEEVLEYTHAANIDLKCFKEETYRNILGGSSIKNALSAVKNFIHTALEKKVHLELTTLVVPGINDSEEELDECIAFVSSLEKEGTVVPWHLTAYHPAYRYSAPGTDPDFLKKIARKARNKIKYVYTGNI